jgi:DNA-binding MarR family transcriptional regulator
MSAARLFPEHEPGSPSEAFTELVLEVFRTNGRLLAAGDRLAAPAGLTSARWQVLGAIESQPLTVAQIARRMGLARQSVQRVADLLAAEGMVAFRDNPNHRRAKLVGPTPQGRDMLGQVGRLQSHWARRIADGLTAGEIGAATRLLRLLRERLEGEAAGDDARDAGNGGAP